MEIRTSAALSIALLLPFSAGVAQKNGVRTAFRIKYVAEGVVYLDGGRHDGLAERMHLSVRRNAPPAQGEMAGDFADLEVISVADASAVCEVVRSSREIQTGDEAWLSPQDVQTLQVLRSSAVSKNYAQVVTFTEGDPLDEEARESVPAPPLPEINRARGRFGFEYNGINEPGGMSSTELGFVFRGDITRIGGTYWNLSGYSRGRFTSQAGGFQQQTLNDLLNRTYHLTLYYNNPQSNWTMGFGRFFLPWAASLSTIDGGYVGRRVGKSFTFGTFAGSTPDPTSWNYKPNRQMLGTFLNYEAGSYDDWRFTSTTGVAVTRLSWHPERQFAFFENGISYKRYLSIYHNLEADKYTKTNGSGAGVTRSFLTFRVQPYKFLAFDLSHNYFRDMPTFDPRLVGTGLLDKLLFQGISGGVRVDLPFRLGLYTNVGKSDRAGDAKSSWNQMYGVVLNRMWWTGIRADARYSRFDSAFGKGSYKSVSFSREYREVFRFELQGGQQNFSSLLTRQNRARWVNGSVDWFVGLHYFVGAGLTVYRGQSQNYNQTYLNAGYRF